MTEHLPTILERGFSTLMDAHRVQDVARLYSLSARVGAIDTLKAAFKDYVRSTGLKLVKDEEKVAIQIQNHLRACLLRYDPDLTIANYAG